MKKTKIASPPLIAALANEWQTLLTALMQAQQISAKVTGSGRKTVISFDLGLYKPARQLQMSRTDMDNLIIRPGDAKSVKVVIIDGMAEIQSLKKPDWIQNCCHLARRFTK